LSQEYKYNILQKGDDDDDDDDDNHHHHHIHHYHHLHLANKELGHLLTCSGLTLPEVLKAIIKYMGDKLRAKKVL